MNRDEVIRLAEEAGAKFDPHWGIAYNCGNQTFVRFADLVEKATIERMTGRVCTQFPKEMRAEEPGPLLPQRGKDARP